MSKEKKHGEKENAAKKKQQSAAASAKGAKPAAPAAVPDACPSCGGKLVDLDDYTFHQRLRRAAACIPTAIAICVAWAVLYALIRLGVGGKLGAAGAGGLAATIGGKVVVGVILGALLGAVAGIWRTDAGLFLGVVIGSLGGFFVAAAKAMPLLSDAAHRADIVVAAIVGGILSGATVIIAHNRAQKKSAKYIGPEPVRPENKS